MPLLTFQEQFGGTTYPPGLCLYLDKEGTVDVGPTSITITIGATQYVVPYVGKTLSEIASEITSSSGPFEAIANCASGNLNNNDISLTPGDEAPDGATIIRIKGHPVRYNAETKIRALPPYSENRLQPWYPRVARGNVAITWNGMRYLFAIPEYQDQEWSSLFGKPYVDQRGIKPEYVDATTLRAPRTPIHWTRGNLGISVNGITLRTIVKDVDVYNGAIKLTVPLDRTDDIRLNYVYEERDLIYKELNLNPSVDQNPGVIDQTCVLYVRPYAWSGGQKRDRTVFHSVGKTITGAITSIDQQNQPVLVVGGFQVKASGVVTDVSTIDTRTRGGGIEGDRFDEALAKNREVYSTADNGRYDGIPFPAAASGVLMLPRSILDRLTDEYIQSVVSRHLAVGGHILVDYYE